MISVILLLILKLICELHCSQLPHVNHICSSGASTEQAGMGSGTVTFDGIKCEITITDIPELIRANSKYSDQAVRLNVVGVRKRGSCGTTKILIDSETYCVSESVKDTVITVTGHQVKFAVRSTPAESFTLKYFRGEPQRSCSTLKLTTNTLNENKTSEVYCESCVDRVIVTNQLLSLE